MKIKQFLSTALALAMTLSLSIPVFAADYETSVSYEGTGTERYELTVPSQLKPGTAGNVTLSGTWASNRHIAVTADETVTMTGSLGGSETLDITFAGIDLAGNNETSVSETKQVSVEAMEVLFDTWTGTFYYNVGASNAGNTTVDPNGGSGSGGTTNPDGSSSPSDPLDGEDLNQAEAFTITETNRVAVGYTGATGETLVIPSTFTGDGNNGTTEGQVYKVTSIGEGAFYSCDNLTSVTIPEGVTSIGLRVFSNCDNLTSVTIPEGVTSIGKEAFFNCSKLSSVTIPESVETIEDSAFFNCTNLTSITIPEKVKTISSCAFYSCSNLESITFNGTKEQWNAISKDAYWNENTGSYTIYCTDGNISK